jgi:L-ascorbate metabolism protein UlaG (beta-lactamase superfamily)
MKRVIAIAAVALGVAACAAPAPTFAPTGKIEVLWLGQAAFKITTVTGKVIVVDPWLVKNPKTPAQYKDLKSLGKVDLILVTHGHGDHLADAPDLAKLNNAPVYGPAGLNQVLTTLGVLPANLSPRFGKGGTITPFGPDGVKVTATHAEHSSEMIWNNPATGKDESHAAGEPVGFVIELENGFKIYHMGDTAVFGDMKWIGERYKPDLILMPIGRHFVMGPEDAAYATREFLKPSFVIPMHYGTIPVLTGKPEEYVKAMAGSPVKVMVLQPGEKAVF